MGGAVSTRAEQGDDAVVLLDEPGNTLARERGIQWATERAGLFCSFLSINTPEAHLAAAMMLVPEGWTADVRRYPDGTGNATLYEWSPPCRNVRSIGLKSPAHALISAISRIGEA